MRTGIVAFAAAAMLAGPALAAPPAKTLCATGEEAQFSCRAGARIVSVCASPYLTADHGYLQYRIGRPGRLEMSFPSTLASPRGRFQWSEHYFTSGWVYRLRFQQGGYDYIVYDQELEGDDKPGGIRPRDIRGGVVVRRDGRLVSHLRCEDDREFIRGGRAGKGVTTEAPYDIDHDPVPER